MALGASGRESRRSPAQSRIGLMDDSAEPAYVAVSTRDDDEETKTLRSYESSDDRNCGQRIVDSMALQNAMAFVIIANGVVIGLETDFSDWKHWDTIEDVFLVIFTADLILKLGAEGCNFFNPSFRDFGWNLFDFFIVALAIFDKVASMLESAGTGGFTTLFRMVRLMRVLRVFRLIKQLKKLYLLAVGLAEACKAVFWVTLLMGIALYVCGIVLVKTVGRPESLDPNYEFLSEHYGNIPDAMLSLFILMSSPNLPVYQDEPGLLFTRPFFTFYLVVFITFGSYGMIAMLTGVINESMFENNELRRDEKRAQRDALRESLDARASELFKQLPLDERGFARVQDLPKVAKGAAELLDETGDSVQHGEILKFMTLMDEYETGFIEQDQFVRAMDKVADGVSPLALMEIQHFASLTNTKLSKQMQRLQDVEDKVEEEMRITLAEVQKIGQAMETKTETQAKFDILASSSDRLHDGIQSCEARIAQTSQDIGKVLQAIERMSSSQTPKPTSPHSKESARNADSLLDCIRSSESRIADSIADQMSRTSEEVSRVLQVVRSSVIRQSDYPSDVFSQQLSSSADRLLDGMRSSESRILASLAQHSEDVSSTVRRFTDKQLKGLELSLPSIVAQQCDTTLKSMQTSAASSEATGVAPAKLDLILTWIQELAKKDERAAESPFSISPFGRRPGSPSALSSPPTSDAQQQFAANDTEWRALVSKVSEMSRQIQSLEAKLLNGVAELGGMTLTGMADLFSQNAVNMKQGGVNQSSRESHIRGEQ